MTREQLEKIKGFQRVIDDWPASQDSLKHAYIELTFEVRSRSESVCEVVTRQGVTHSFRAGTSRDLKSARPVFVLIDTVVSDVDPWFLSVCFYEDEITDPEESGEAIPGGLLGETGYCFDLEEYDEDYVAYLKTRIAEAHGAALNRP